MMSVNLSLPVDVSPQIYLFDAVYIETLSHTDVGLKKNKGLHFYFDHMSFNFTFYYDNEEYVR